MVIEDDRELELESDLPDLSDLDLAAFPACLPFPLPPLPAACIGSRSVADKKVTAIHSTEGVRLDFMAAYPTRNSQANQALRKGNSWPPVPIAPESRPTRSG